MSMIGWFDGWFGLVDYGQKDTYGYLDRQLMADIDGPFANRQGIIIRPV